jgi:hypothetical protein
MPFKVPNVRFPQHAIRRLPRQASAVHYPYSCQQEIVVTCPSNAQLSTWLDGPPSHSRLTILLQDFDRVLPFTTLTFTSVADDEGPAPHTGFECNMTTETGAGSQDVRDYWIEQINDYATQMATRYPNMRSLKALTVSTLIPGFYRMRILMPFGMIGAAGPIYSGPVSGEARAEFSGVDNPTVYGILGKRRHVFGVKNPLLGPYYGPVPPT